MSITITLDRIKNLKFPENAIRNSSDVQSDIVNNMNSDIQVNADKIHSFFEGIDTVYIFSETLIENWRFLKTLFLLGVQNWKEIIADYNPQVIKQLTKLKNIKKSDFENAIDHRFVSYDVDNKMMMEVHYNQMHNTILASNIIDYLLQFLLLTTVDEDLQKKLIAKQQMANKISKRVLYLTKEAEWFREIQEETPIEVNDEFLKLLDKDSTKHQKLYRKLAE